MKANLKINVFLAAILLVGLTACNQPKNQSKKQGGNGVATAQKTDSGTTVFSGAKKQVTEYHGKKITWWGLSHAKWSKNFYGLKIKIEPIALTRQIPDIQLGKKTPAIRMQFTMNNLSKKKFEFSPARATLFTSTGKKIKAAMMITDKFNGEIVPGETKKITVGFYLPEADLSQIKWIKLHMSGTRISSQSLKKKKEKAIDTGKIFLK